MTIVKYLQKVTEAEFQTIGPLYLHAVCGTSHLQTVQETLLSHIILATYRKFSGNRQIHTKCQLQYLHPPQVSTNGKCHCVIIHQTTKATECIGYIHCHIYAQITVFITFTTYLELWPGNHLIWCNATLNISLWYIILHILLKMGWELFLFGKSNLMSRTL